jgi:uncharacterized protein involved in exopolysaccharide biosynthesis
MNESSAPHSGTRQPPTVPATPPRFSASIVFAVWLLIVLIGTIATFLLPESYVSTARIKIERDHPEIQGMSEPAVANTYDPYFIQTECEVLQSEAVLSNVVYNLHLNKIWGKQYSAPGEELTTRASITILKQQIDLRPVRNTSLIEIRVFSDKPEEAAHIANEIAGAYQSYRKEQRTALKLGAINVLKEQQALNERKLRDVRAQLAMLSRGQSPTNAERLDEARTSLDELQRFGQTLFTRLSSEQVDASLPANGMVRILDSAMPGMRPIRPNKPLNIFISIIVGGLVGLFLATLIYVLQRREFRCDSGAPRTLLQDAYEPHKV